MADDLNLPNLVSHLQVNLGNTNGLVADATRQGSSVGSAIGTSMQRTLRAAVDDIPDVEIDGDSTELDRDLARVRRQLQQLSERRIGVDISIEDALQQMARLEPHLERLQHSHPSVNVTAAVGGAWADLTSILDAARQVDDTDVDIDVDADTDHADRGLERVRAGLGRVVGMLGSLGGLAGGFAKAAAAIGTLVPLVGGLAATLAHIAPAAAVGVSALIALQLATKTLKLAMTGVGDAVKAALDPSDPEAYAEALKKLSPNARSFVQEIHKASPALDKIRKTVQDKVFAGLDKQLASTAKVALPDIRKALDSTSATLNKMAKGVFTAARGLAKDGTLGTALRGATTGLSEFSRAPGQVVTALGQIGAAAAPAFERLSKAGGKALDKLFERLTKAFESGGMEKAIDLAIDLIGDLAEIVGNVASVLGSMFKAANVSGGGFIGTLKEVTGALSDAFASPEVQGGLKAIFATMATIAKTVGPLLTMALKAIGPVFEKLGPPIQTVVKALGKALEPVIKALGPVLESLATAFGSLIVALSPLLPVAGQLIAALLPALIPLFDALGRIFEAAAPFIAQFAETLGATLTPLLEGLAPIVEALVEPFAKLAEDLFPILTDILVELTPSLSELAETFGELMVELAPVIVEWFNLASALSDEVLPIISKVAIFLAKVLSVELKALSAFLQLFVIPAIKITAALMRGDFTEATRLATDAAIKLREKASEAWAKLRDKMAELVIKMRDTAIAKAIEIRDGFAKKMDELRTKIKERIGRVPGDIRSALGDTKTLLINAGANIIRGLIAGIQSKIGELKAKLGSVTSLIPDWKGPESVDKRLLVPAGVSIMQGLQRGIAGQIPALRAQLAGITAAIPTMVINTPAPRQLASAYAGTGGGNDTYNINMYGAQATPGDLVRELSWRGLVGRSG